MIKSIELNDLWVISCLSVHCFLYRGDNIDFGHRVAPVVFQSGRTVTDGNAVPTSPTEIERSYGDMLITYSTLPGLLIIFSTQKFVSQLLFNSKFQDMFHIVRKAKVPGLSRLSV